MGWESVIKKAFPNALIKPVGNYDDAHSGWDICPEPGVTIVFQQSFDTPLLIRITSQTMSGIFVYEPSVTRKYLFYGVVPQHQDGDPDENFVLLILKNWKNIG